MITNEKNFRNENVAKRPNANLESLRTKGKYDRSEKSELLLRSWKMYWYDGKHFWDKIKKIRK